MTLENLRRVMMAAFVTVGFSLLVSPQVVQASGDDAEPAIDPDTSIEELRLRLVPLTVDELAQEAAAWQKVAQDRTQRVVDQRIAVLRAAPTETAALRDGLPGLLQERRADFDKLSEILKAWEAKGGDADAIASYRRYMSTVRADEIKAIDTSTVWTMTKTWLVSKDGGLRLGLMALGFLFALGILYVVARLVARFARRGLGRLADLSTLLREFLVKAAFWATMVLGVLTLLSLLGVRLTPILTLLGGLSFVLAFATQNTLSNFAAGLMIMIYKPFDIGHVVTISGVTGTVREMSLVSTTLVTGDNQLIVVPNSNVWGSMITNINASDTRRVDLTFGIDYRDDEERAQQILEEVVRSHPLVLPEPEPVIRLHSLAESSVNFVCRPWVRTGDYWTVYWDLTRQVKDRFDEAGISIPFPQRDVHIYTHAAQAEAAAAAAT
jgi:small conductance mechanosensitive channel